MDKPTDYFGNEIEVGDIVAYPTSRSSSASMNHGVVWQVRPYPSKVYNCKTRDYEEQTHFKLGLRKLGSSGYWATYHDEAQPKVTIDKIGRCINLSKVKLDKPVP